MMKSGSYFFFPAEDGIRDGHVTGVQTCALPIFTDQGGLTTTQTFALAVTDVNEAPSAITLASGGAIAENAANGTVVAQVAGHDPDTAHGDVLTYALTDNAGGRFRSEERRVGKAGATRSSLDHEAETSNALTARAHEQDGRTTTRRYTLCLRDGSAEACSSALASGGAIAENAANGTVVAQVAGHDPDTAHGDVLTYALTDNAGGRFRSEERRVGKAGATRSSLDHEAETSNALTARAHEQDGRTTTRRYTLCLRDGSAEACSSALASGGAIAENAANGTVVAQVAGHDPDTAHGDVLTYALTDNAGGRFAIDATSGVITVANGSLLDYEAVGWDDVTVRVTWPGGLTTTHTHTHAPTDVNEAPRAPTLAPVPSTTLFRSNGTVVAQVAGHDPDTAHGDVLTYALTDNAGGRFAIDATSGVITVANGSLLDYEHTTELQSRGHLVCRPLLATT